MGSCAAYLAGGCGDGALLPRHSALADASEALPQGLFQGLDPGQRALHRQGVVGVQRTPATGVTAKDLCCFTLLPQIPSKYKSEVTALNALLNTDFCQI